MFCYRILDVDHAKVLMNHGRYFSPKGWLENATSQFLRIQLIFGAVGSDVGQINEVTLRRARLVLGWVTVSGFNSRCGKYISV